MSVPEGDRGSKCRTEQQNSSAEWLLPRSVVASQDTRWAERGSGSYAGRLIFATSPWIACCTLPANWISNCNGHPCPGLPEQDDMKTNWALGAAAALVASLVGCGDDATMPGAGGAGATSASVTSTTTSAASTSSAGGGGAGGQGGEGGSMPSDACADWPLTNNSAACEATTVAPYAGEESHWIAERLTPPSYPFTVTKVRYTLFSGPQNSVTCDNGLAHQADVFVGTAVIPPATPAVVEHFDVPASADVPGLKIFDHALATPLTLEAGEFLFVAVQNAGTSPNDCTCFGSCEGAPFTEDANYWSYAGAPPYAWDTLESSQIKVNYTVCADGAP